MKVSSERQVVFGSWQGFLAYGFGSGLSPWAPGTMGTLVAVPCAWWLKSLPLYVYLPFIALTFLLGVYLCDVTSKRLERHDPGGIVWDEMVGFWLAVVLVPAHWGWLAAGFAAFRFFDILKPWPIRKVEKRFGGGLGIMLDDIVAALYALAVLLLVAQVVQGT